jgi:MFS family permease
MLRNPLTLLASLPPTVRLLVYGTFVNRLGTFIIPFLTLVLRREFRLTEAQTGAAIFAYGAGSIVSILTGGYLSDRLGRRRTLLISLFGSGTLAVAMGVAPSLGVFSVLLLLFGFVADLYRPASSSIVGDLLPSSQRPIGFAALRVAINLGFAGGVAVGGFLADANWRILFWADGATTLLFGLVVFATIVETRPAAAVTARAEGTVETPWRDRVYHLALLSSFVFALGFFADITVLPLTLTESAGYSAKFYGWLLAINGVVVGLLEIPAAHWLRRFRRLRVAALGMVLGALGLLMTGLNMHWTWLVLSVLIWTVGEVLTMPQHMSFVADWAPPASRGTYLGLYSATWSFGLALNPILFLPLHSRLSEAAFWGLVGAITATPSLLCLYLDRRADRPELLRGADHEPVSEAQVIPNPPEG